MHEYSKSTLNLFLRNLKYLSWLLIHPMNRTNKKKFALKYRDVLSTKSKGSLFLALGPSLNSLKPSRVSALRHDGHLVVGLSRCLILDYEPDFVVWELSHLDRTKKLTEVLLKKLTETDSTALLTYKATEPEITLLFHDIIPDCLKDRVYFVPIIAAGPRTIASAPKFFHFYSLITSIFKTSIPFIHVRSSSIAVIWFLLRFTNRNITIIGVDGRGGYAASEDNVAFHSDFKDAKNSGNLHSTSDPSYGRPTVPEFLEILDQNFEDRIIHIK